jgi:hypothetical protein
MFVLEQSLSVKALQEVVSGAHQLTVCGFSSSILHYNHYIFLNKSK